MHKGLWEWQWPAGRQIGSKGVFYLQEAQFREKYVGSVHL